MLSTPTSNPRHRPAAVAGLFYPGDAEALANDVDRMLAAAQPEPQPAPRALIAPHAGYVYSGAIAASAYAGLQSHPARVVLAGPSHRVAFRGIALSSAGAFDTPLGPIPVDVDEVARLAERDGVAVLDAAHAEEHSLEVHLPFLARKLGSFRLLPLVIGDATPAQVADVLGPYLDAPDTLVVASTDLSHYHPYQEARHLDAATRRRVEDLRSDIRPEEACGCRVLNGLLAACSERGLVVRTLDQRSSGDTAGDRARVVGYAAFAVSAELSPSEGGLLVDAAHASLRHGLANDGAPDTDVDRFPGPLRQPRATFVTLRRAGALRGCIGSLEPGRPLVRDVVENAYSAGFKDPRFPPLAEDELNGLEVHISVLHRPEPLPFEDEPGLLAQLRPGVDGLVIESDEARATFLPSVWQNLSSAAEFLARLKQKAGMDAGESHYRASRYRVQAFDSLLR